MECKCYLGTIINEIINPLFRSINILWLMIIRLVGLDMSRLKDAVKLKRNDLINVWRLHRNLCFYGTDFDPCRYQHKGLVSNAASKHFILYNTSYSLQILILKT